jgi:flagellar hook protein FlgE
VGGILTSTVASPAVDAVLNGLTVIDANGGTHSVNLTFKDLGSGSYTVNIADANGGAALGSGTLKFAAGFPAAGFSTINFNYAATGVPSFAVQLDFNGVQNSLQATSLNMLSQDGYVAGTRTDQSIDADGTISVRYSNGQTAKGPRIAMAEFQTEGDLEQQGGSFKKRSGAPVRYGYAGDGPFGSLVSGHREGSNVDLAEEFGNLILMQRGYQASSHVISTANDMIQQLFDMKGNR